MSEPYLCLLMSVRDSNVVIEKYSENESLHLQCKSCQSKVGHCSRMYDFIWVKH